MLVNAGSASVSVLPDTHFGDGAHPVQVIEGLEHLLQGQAERAGPVHP